MTLNRFGCPEYRFFVDEKYLDNYLRNDPITDIWEKEALFREIASGSEHGVFCIHDLKSQEKSYFQKKQGWLQHGFEKVTFRKMLLEKTFFLSIIPLT
jgi:hypothetical protein